MTLIQYQDGIRYDGHANFDAKLSTGQKLREREKKKSGNDTARVPVLTKHRNQVEEYKEKTRG